MVVIDENDNGKSREQILMDLIYETNTIRIPLDKIKFGSPSEVDKRKDLDNDPNTFIPVKIDQQYDARFSFPTSGIMYRRRSVSKHVQGFDLNTVMPLFLPFKMSDILDQINVIVPYEFHTLDIVNREYKTLEEVEAGITLEARKNAYLWFGKVVFDVNTGGINGDPLINVTTLDGFNQYVPA